MRSFIALLLLSLSAFSFAAPTEDASDDQLAALLFNDPASPRTGATSPKLTIVSFTDYMAQHPDSNLKVVATTEEASNVSIPMRKGEETASLMEAINQAIAELREDGVLSELSTRFFGEDISE